MKKNQKFIIKKSIPLGNGNNIPVNTEIHRIHGVYYMNGVLLSPDYQQDFDNLIEKEENNGWNYLNPVVEKIAFKNTKEDI
jgi:hypothetical protein